MNTFKSLIAGAGLGAALALSAGGASAAITTFADFSATSGIQNVNWHLNNGMPTSTAGFYTVNSKAVQGATLVNFEFLQGQLSSVGPLKALFTLDASTITPGVNNSGSLVQGGITGSFSFISTTSITIGSKTFAAGSNLLSATFADGGLTGQSGSTSGGFNVSTGAAGETITYTSDILNFANVVDADASLSLSSITKALSLSPGGHPINTFRALTTGSFASDPAPIAAIPEPATWALMIVGLGFMGGALRLRNKGLALTA